MGADGSVRFRLNERHEWLSPSPLEYLLDRFGVIGDPPVADLAEAENAIQDMEHTFFLDEINQRARGERTECISHFILSMFSRNGR